MSIYLVKIVSIGKLLQYPTINQKYCQPAQNSAKNIQIQSLLNIK